MRRIQRRCLPFTVTVLVPDVREGVLPQPAVAAWTLLKRVRRKRALSAKKEVEKPIVARVEGSGVSTAVDSLKNCDCWRTRT